MYFTFKNKFTCPICKDLILDPVIIGCGHSFCRPCLYLLWEEAENPPCCPVCRESSYKINFKTSIALKKQAFVARVKGLTHLPSSEQQMCMIHMKTKDFFCEVVKDTLCRTCSKSEEHKSHRHSSIPWIAEEYRQKLLEQMRLLWEKMQENKINLTRETNKIRTWEDHVALRRKMICADFQKEFPLPDSEERMYLQKLEYESKEIFHQLNKSENCMAQKGELLRKVYKELKEMCHQPDIKLIQHFEELKERSELVQLHMPQSVDPKLSSRSIPGLIHRLNDFQVHIFLDHEVLTSHVSLFEDLRQRLFSRDYLDVDHKQSKSKYFLSWGSQTFTSGKYYWNVDVGHCWNWVIGFCNDSWTGKNDMLVNSQGIFLLFCVKENNQCTLYTSSPLLPQYVERPLGLVGVFLDYECGTVSFIDEANNTLLYNFPSCSFSYPLRPFLCCGCQ